VKTPKSIKTPAASGAPMVALLRGINVGGNKRVPMAELRTLANGLGFRQVDSYIQSGNLVFSTELAPEAAELTLERAILDHFGFPVQVIVRTATKWESYATKSPFRGTEAERPHLLLLGVSKQPVKSGAAKALRDHANAGERIEVLGDAIWIDFATSVASSKLTPTVLDRCVGSTVTARNWRTLQKLAEMLRTIV
jgi:uncharacterized protein (DUF1697 family)